MDLQFIGIMVLLAAFIAARFISEKATRFLEDAQKTTLMEGFSKYRLYFLLPIVLVIVLYYAGVKLFPYLRAQITLACVALLAVYVIITNALMLKKLRDLAMPVEYTRRFFLARAILYASLAAFIYIFATMARVE